MNKKDNTKIKKSNVRIYMANGTPVTWCLFCGAKVGQISERTNKEEKAVYYCPNVGGIIVTNAITVLSKLL